MAIIEISLHADFHKDNTPETTNSRFLQNRNRKERAPVASEMNFLLGTIICVVTISSVNIIQKNTLNKCLLICSLSIITNANCICVIFICFVVVVGYGEQCTR